VVESVTDLGVTYDNKLKFGPHIDKVCFKALSRAKLILKCFQTRSPSILLKAYYTFVRQILEYASVVWSPYNTVTLTRLKLSRDILQNVLVV